VRGLEIRLKPGKAPGYDHIPIYFIKRSFELISEPLKHVVNMSLETGILKHISRSTKSSQNNLIFKTGEADHKL
jgi:hypothetical protein